MANFTLTYDSELKKSKWYGYPDPNYSFEGDILFWEREITNEDGKKRTVKTCRDPIEIIADFKPESKVYGFDKEGKIEKAAVETFGGCLKGFVWITNISGSGEVVLPCTAPHIFLALGSRLNPKLVEISDDVHAENYYEVIDNKTHVHVKGFSGVGAAAGVPPTLIAHYKMNDDAATAVVVDETGNHNGTYKDAGGDLNTDTGASTGKTNGALAFDGTDEYVEIADHADLRFGTGDFSIVVWFKLQSSTAHRALVSKGVQTGVGEWVFYITSSDNLVFVTDSTFLGDTGDYDDDIWHQAIVTRNGDVGKLYVDAVNTRTSATYFSGKNFNTTKVLGIGARNPPTWERFFLGLLDNISFYKKGLTIDDIKILYAGGHGTEILADLDESRRIKRRPIWQR